VTGGYTADQRRTIERAIAAGQPLHCPACTATLSAIDVPASRQVSYVRRRVWLICPDCRRSVAVDAVDGPAASQ
jgi:hypothetical protein